MRLHYYAPPVHNSYCVGIHNGHGFGALFGKLFSKVASKTVAKAAVSAAKSAGKKALTVVAKKGVQFAKEAAKEGLKQAAEIGTELATAKINSLADSAINKNLPPEIVQSIRDIATRGVGAAGTAVQTLGTQKVHRLIDRGSAKAENLGSRLIDKGENWVGNRLIDRLPGGTDAATTATAIAAQTRPKQPPHPTTTAATTTTRKRKKKPSKKVVKSKKRKTTATTTTKKNHSLANILDSA